MKKTANRWKPWAISEICPQRLQPASCILLVGALLAHVGPSAAAEPSTFTVTGHNAVADGATLNTAAIQSAIDACAAAGGGTVHFPPGKYLTGTLFLKDHVRLHLDQGARILGSPNIADYPPTTCAYPSRTDRYTARALIWGEGLEDIAITGYGAIDGQGALFHGKTASAEDMAAVSAEYEAAGRYLPNPAFFNRPYLIRLISCRRVLVENVTLRDSAMWMQHYLNCEHLAVRGIKVFNHVGRNNDMIDIDCCRHVTISDCYGDTDDDALTLKSTGDHPTEHVTITNCILRSHCNALKAGTESSGGFKDIAITNCVIGKSESEEVIAGRREGLAGIALEIVDGGTLERVTISNITIKDTTAPLFLRLGNRARPAQPSQPKPPVGTFRHVSISNIVATGASMTGCAIAGLPEHPIEGLSLSNIRIEFLGGGTPEHAQATPPENENGYPESTMFGVLPAYGLYCRHVKGLSMDNVTLTLQDADLRPALVCEDVQDLRLDAFHAQSGASAPAQIVLRHTQRALITGASPESQRFLSLGPGCSGITVTACDLTRAATPFTLDPSLPADTFRAVHNVVQD